MTIRERHTISCKDCEAEITHCSKESILALAQASGWEPLPSLYKDDYRYKCSVCIEADKAEADNESDSSACRSK